MTNLKEYCKNCKIPYCKNKQSILPFNYSKEEVPVYIVLNYPIKKEVDKNVSPIEGFTELDYGDTLGGYKYQDSDRMTFLRRLFTGGEKLFSNYFISNYKISSLVSCYPNENDSIILPTDEDISYCSKLLTEDIIKSKSKVVVTVGEKTFQSIMEDNTLQLKYNLGKTLIKKLNDSYEIYIIPLPSIFALLPDKNSSISITEPDLYPETANSDNNLIYILNRFRILERKQKENSRLNAEDTREFKKIKEIISQVKVAMRKIYHISNNTFIDIDRLDITAVRNYDGFKDWVNNNINLSVKNYFIAYDIETNAASQYSDKFDIIGFSLALEKKGVYVNLKSLDFEMSEKENKLCKNLLKEVLRNAEKIIVHNCLYELPATRFNLDLDIPFKQLDDTLVMAKLMLGGKTGAGLKDNAQRIGYDDWESDLLVYVNNFNAILSSMNLVKYKPVIEKLREGVEIYSYLTNPVNGENFQEETDKNQDKLLSLFGEEIVTEGFKKSKKIRKSKKMVNFTEEYKEVIQLMEEIVDVIKKYYSEEELPKVLKLFSEKILYGLDSGLLGNVIPYNWIPSKMLERYGAADAVATYDLKNYYSKRFEKESTEMVQLSKGYKYMLMEHYVGHKLMLSGMAWNDKVAQRDFEMYSKISIESLKYLFSNPILQEYIITNKSELLLPEVLYTYYNDWLWDTYQKNIALIEDKGTKTYKLKYINSKGAIAYKHIKYLLEEIENLPVDIKKDVDKKMIDLLMSIVNKAITLEDLKDYFNPSSVKEEVKIVANKILMTPLVKFGNFLTYAKVALMNREKKNNPEEQNDNQSNQICISHSQEEQFFKDLKSYLDETDYQKKKIKFNYLFKVYAYSVIRMILSEEEIKKYCKNKIIVNFSDEYLKKAITSMNIRDRGNEKYFGELSSLDDPAQIAVFDSLAMTFINPDDYSTWNDTLKWLLNFRLFKKANKILSSYLEGVTGRESVFEVDKNNLESGSDLLIREIPYEEIQPRKDCIINTVPILPEDKSLIIHTDFRVSQTATGRWNCLSGDTEIFVITSDKIDMIRDLGKEDELKEDSELDEIEHIYSNEKLKQGSELFNQLALEKFEEDSSDNSISKDKIKEIEQDFIVEEDIPIEVELDDSIVSIKTLEELKESKERDFWVYSYDIELNKLVLGFCHFGSQVSGRNVPVFKIDLSNNTSIKCTKEHRILMNNNSYKMARDLKKGDILKGNIFVTGISYSCVEDKVYDIEIDKYHNFMLANGVIVHNSGFHTLPAMSTIKNLYRSRFKGGIVLQPDFASNEIRCVASFSNETKMLKAFQEGKDIHRANASAMYHIPYEEVTKAQRRVAKGFCIHGDTKIRLLSGKSKTVSELYEDNQKGLLDDEWVYSYNSDSDRIDICKIIDVIQQREEYQYIEITLDNGKTVITTLDHKFIKRDGTEVEAKDLQINDSLMATYFRYNKDGEFRLAGGYEILQDLDGEWIPTHRKVAQCHQLPEMGESIKKKTVIHHTTFNKLDNRPTKLAYVNGKEHFTIHGQSKRKFIEECFYQYFKNNDNFNHLLNSSTKDNIENYLIDFCTDYVFNYFSLTIISKYINGQSQDVLDLISFIVNDNKFKELLQIVYDKTYSSFRRRQGKFNLDNLENYSSERKRENALLHLDELSRRGKNGIKSMVRLHFSHLIKNGLEVNEENYYKYYPQKFNIIGWANIEKSLDITIGQLIEEAKVLPNDGFVLEEYTGDFGWRSTWSDRVLKKLWESKDFRQRHTERESKKFAEFNSNPDMIIKQQRHKIAKYFRFLFDNGFTKESLLFEYETIYPIVKSKYARRGFSVFKSDTILKYFDSLESAIDFAEHFNHQVVSIKVIKSNTPIKFYDLSIDKCHNFLVDLGDNSGIYLHNSFSILYGSGVKSIAENYFDGDEQEAQEQLDNFYKTFPKLKKWMSSKIKEVQATAIPSETEEGILSGRVSTLTHRFITIDYNPKDKRSMGSLKRQSVNFCIQSSASTAAAITFFNIIQNQEERGFKTKPICFIHDSLESDVYPYELFEIMELQNRILHKFAEQILGLELKADISLGLSMGEECELRELEIYDNKKTKGRLVLAGYKDELLHLIEQWKTVYYKVDYKELEFEEEFVPLSRLFMPKTAFNPYIWNTRYLGKMEIEIEYYDEKGNINPVNPGEPKIDSVWDNCPILDYVGK